MSDLSLTDAQPEEQKGRSAADSTTSFTASAVSDGEEYDDFDGDAV